MEAVRSGARWRRGVAAVVAAALGALGSVALRPRPSATEPVAPVTEEPFLWAADRGADEVVALGRVLQHRFVRALPDPVGLVALADGGAWVGLGAGRAVRLDARGGTLEDVPLPGVPRALARDPRAGSGAGSGALALLAPEPPAGARLVALGSGGATQLALLPGARRLVTLGPRLAVAFDDGRTRVYALGEGRGPVLVAVGSRDRTGDEARTLAAGDSMLWRARGSQLFASSSSFGAPLRALLEGTPRLLCPRPDGRGVWAFFRRDGRSHARRFRIHPGRIEGERSIEIGLADPLGALALEDRIVLHGRGAILLGDAELRGQRARGGFDELVAIDAPACARRALEPP